MELSFPASPARLAELRRSLRAGLHGTVPERDLDDILLAVNEAATNAMLHGSGAGRPVEVTVHLRGEWIEANVLDHGPSLRGGPADAREGSDLGGRGLWLIGRLVDEVRLERVDLGTRITLRRRVGDRAGPAADR